MAKKKKAAVKKAAVKKSVPNIDEKKVIKTPLASGKYGDGGRIPKK